MKAVIQFASKLDQAIIPISSYVLEKLGWAIGDEVELDIPMLGGGLRIYKDREPYGEQQRAGDEVV